ncbi:MAG: hypothetical protein GX240_04940 [Candidatus Atribacteria bacterium]|nr:hypothetical protein [Candidatus Atribacteria bacterium]
MKKTLVFLLIIFFTIFAITGCDGVTPPNGTEGEGEGEEAVKQVVLVETFVTNNCPVCAKLKPHLEKLASEYSRDEMILVEIIPWGIYSIPESKTRHYDWYNLASTVPHTIFNGLASYLAGSHDYSTLKNRIDAQLNIPPKVSIQANRIQNGQNSVISGTIKNIGTTTLSNMVINGMTFKRSGNLAYAATYIFEKEKVPVPALAVGETKNFSITLTDINWDGKGFDGVIFVQETTGKKRVHQSLFIN